MSKQSFDEELKIILVKVFCQGSWNESIQSAVEAAAEKIKQAIREEQRLALFGEQGDKS